MLASDLNYSSIVHCIGEEETNGFHNIDTRDLYHKHNTIVNDDASVVSKWCSKLKCNLGSELITLAKARAKACAKAKHIYNTDINYDRHLRSSKYFYSTGHRAQVHFNHRNFSIHIEEANMQFQYPRSFYMVLKSAEG